MDEEKLHAKLDEINTKSTTILMKIEHLEKTVDIHDKELHGDPIKLGKGGLIDTVLTIKRDAIIIAGVVTFCLSAAVNGLVRWIFK